ncbi:MAG: SurA N-terminal domain-containing protein, partial [Rickettsiales bacterium]|nr:SurA N-terminal domain-containing protein [Rickettsiales bacterium]
MIKFYKTLLISYILFLYPTYILAKQNVIVAKVNNSAITNIELDDRYNFIIKTANIRAKNEEEKDLIISQILDKIIDEELIRQDAKRYNISNTSEEIEEAVELLAIRNNQNIKKLKQSFARNGFSYSNYLNQISSEILWSKIISN